VQRLLVHRKLNSNIQPRGLGRLDLGNDAAVLGVGPKGLGRNKALADTANDKVAVPEESKETEHCQEALDAVELFGGDGIRCWKRAGRKWNGNRSRRSDGTYMILDTEV
jgi:hypothetical protein